METILQIEVEKDVLRDAENVAEYAGFTVAELARGFVTNLASKKNVPKPSNEVNSRQELIEALEVGLDDIRNGRTRTFTHEEFLAYLDDLRRKYV
jgi:antitoxin component of RelBE/YafQ-DinJ toxin-antitoxin module